MVTLMNKALVLSLVVCLLHGARASVDSENFIPYAEDEL